MKLCTFIPQSAHIFSPARTPAGERMTRRSDSRTLKRRPPARRDGAAIDDAVHAALSRALFEGRLAPGSKLPEHRLATIFNVSRERIRKVLHRLVAERRLEAIPQRGTFVPNPSPEEIRTVYRAHRVFEAGVLTQLVRELDDAILSRIDAHLSEEREAASRSGPGGLRPVVGRLSHAAGRLAGQRRIVALSSRAARALVADGFGLRAGSAFLVRRRRTRRDRRGAEVARRRTRHCFVRRAFHPYRASPRAGHRRTLRTQHRGRLAAFRCYRRRPGGDREKSGKGRSATRPVFVKLCGRQAGRAATSGRLIRRLDFIRSEVLERPDCAAPALDQRGCPDHRRRREYIHADCDYDRPRPRRIGAPGSRRRCRRCRCGGPRSLTSSPASSERSCQTRAAASIAS